MKIAELMDVDVLKAHIEGKLVAYREHDNLPLHIYNYTPKTMFDCLWDDVTEQCRGLIVHAESGDVVARPFRKFFNYETRYRPETQVANFPAGVPEITTKMDGSLGVLYRFGGEVAIATRGSFDSFQALYATDWYKRNLAHAEWPEGWTPLFEIVCADNRIVVKYDWEGLILLGMVNIATGEEMPWGELAGCAERNKCPVVQLHNKEIAACVAENIPNEEGYVTTWHREGQSPLKLKIKFADYFRIHKLLTSVSPKLIWEYLSEGWDFPDLIKDAPAEYQKWVEDWRTELQGDYDRICSEAQRIFAAKPEGGRKTIALYFTSTENKEYSSVLFQMLDGHPWQEAAWKKTKRLTVGHWPFQGVDE